MAITEQLEFTRPFAGAELIDFLGRRAVPGVEEVVRGRYRRTLRLGHGPALLELAPHADAVDCRLRLSDARDRDDALARCRRLLDLDADPRAVEDALGGDRDLGPVLRSCPGRRLPGHVDGFELAVRAILGQQVSVAGARTLAGRFVESLGEPLPEPEGGLTHLFPNAEAVARADSSRWPLPASRRRALRELARAAADGDLELGPQADRERTRSVLDRLHGIGPWTRDYIGMRALGDRDAFLAGDLGVRAGMRRLGLPDAPRDAERHARRWSPWRSYAVQHLWAAAPVARELQAA